MYKYIIYVCARYRERESESVIYSSYNIIYSSYRTRNNIVATTS